MVMRSGTFNNFPHFNSTTRWAQKNVHYSKKQSPTSVPTTTTTTGGWPYTPAPNGFEGLFLKFGGVSAPPLFDGPRPGPAAAQGAPSAPRCPAPAAGPPAPAPATACPAGTSTPGPCQAEPATAGLSRGTGQFSAPARPRDAGSAGIGQNSLVSTILPEPLGGGGGQTDFLEVESDPLPVVGPQSRGWAHLKVVCQ